MRLNRDLAKRILGETGESSRFFCSDGSVFSGLENLKEGLGKMDNKTYSNHSGGENNDFSNWVRECLGDVRLADGLVGLDKKGALKKIGARITYIERYLEKKR